MYPPKHLVYWGLVNSSGFLIGSVSRVKYVRQLISNVVGLYPIGARHGAFYVNW